MKEFYIKMCCLYFNILQGELTPLSRALYKSEFTNYRMMYKQRLNRGAANEIHG